ncbi:MAG: NAD(P)-dependent oxidoreductase [Neisseriaceae bacterium]|nr:NAD(P)-dependent oxidoreductase [Neisseriaceae bacterium]
MNTQAPLKVGYIGLGIMGAPCVLNLLKAGFEVGVWARHEAAAANLIQHGATWFESVQSLATEVDILMTNVSDTADVQALLLGEHGVVHQHKQGLICVDMSTINPLAAREIAAQLQTHGIAFLDAPVSGGEVGAQNGTLTIMVGGDTQALARVQPVLLAMGKTITHIGESGAGQVAKSCNQIGVAVGIAAVAEIMKLAQACGVNPQNVRDALMGGFAQSRVLDVHGQRMIDDNYAPGFKAALHHKDMGIVLDTASRLNITLPFSQQVADLIEEQTQENPNLDSSAIAKILWQRNA